jgi:hypothetical protein
MKKPSRKARGGGLCRPRYGRTPFPATFSSSLSPIHPCPLLRSTPRAVWAWGGAVDGGAGAGAVGVGAPPRCHVQLAPTVHTHKQLSWVWGGCWFLVPGGGGWVVRRDRCMRALGVYLTGTPPYGPPCVSLRPPCVSLHGVGVQSLPHRPGARSRGKGWAAGRTACCFGVEVLLLA